MNDKLCISLKLIRNYKKNNKETGLDLNAIMSGFLGSKLDNKNNDNDSVKDIKNMVNKGIKDIRDTIKDIDHEDKK